MDLMLNGKRALVTGGSKGIGKAIARQLALEGTRVAIAARNRDDLLKTADELARETGQKIEIAVGDTGNDQSARAMVDTAAEAMNGLDILINSAANPAGGPSPKLPDMTEQALWEDVNVKVMGYIRTAQATAPYMMSNGWGRIINISGLNARASHSIIGSVRNISVAAMSKALADELGPHGINVNVVHPGLTRTEKTPDIISATARARGVTEEEAERLLTSGVLIGRMVDAVEVADIVAFLASPRSVAIMGDTIACGGGTRGVTYY